MKYLQVIDGAVVSVFAAQQDPDIWPGVIEAEDDDPRYLAFVAPQKPAEVTDPTDKLKAFLAENPDVADLLK